MSKTALMLVGSMRAVGGVQYVNRLLREALLGLDYKVLCRALLDAPTGGPPILSRLYRAACFIVGAQLDRRWRPSLLLADHARIAYKARFFHAQRATKVVFAHGLEVWKHFDSRVYDTFQRSDFILCNSQFTRHRIIDMYRLDADQCVHVALGVDSVGTTNSSFGARTNDFIVLGRTVAGRCKGHEPLLRAWTYVREKAPKAVLRIVGDGNDLDRLKNLAAHLALGDHVRFEGQLDDVDKRALLHSARGLFMLSKGEGFGLASAEAMAAGTPVIGLEGTVTAELLSHNIEGILLPNSSAEAISNVVSSLSEDSDRWERLSHAARARWRTEFSRESCVKRVREAFKARLPELRGTT